MVYLIKGLASYHGKKQMLKKATSITLQLKQVTLNLDLEIMYPLSFQQTKSRFTQVKDSVNCLDSK